MMVLSVSLRSLRMSWPTTKSHCKQNIGNGLLPKKRKMMVMLILHPLHMGVQAYN
jgi:hypothetical protein